MENWRRYENITEREDYLTKLELLEEGILRDSIANLKKGFMSFFAAPKEFLQIVMLSKAHFKKDIVEMEKALPEDEEFMKIINAIAKRAADLIKEDNPDILKEMLARKEQRILEEQRVNEAEKGGSESNPFEELIAYARESNDPKIKALVKEAHEYHDRKVVETWESATAKASGKAVTLPADTKEFLLYVLKSNIGKVIFGVVDNYIMFLVGAAIDAMFGNMFLAAGASIAMAAAMGMGVGNGVSDAAGVGVEDTLEDDLKEIGLDPTKIDTEDLENSPGYKSWWKLLNSKGIGMFAIFTGCILGMFPLVTGVGGGIGVAAAGVAGFKGVKALKKRQLKKQKEKDTLDTWIQSAQPDSGK